MTRIDSGVWERLSAQLVYGDSLWVRRPLPDVDSRLLSALDADGKRHFLVELSTGEEDFEDRLSRGVSVSTRELSVPGANGARYIDLVCEDAAGYDLFDLIGGEIASGLGRRTEVPADVVSKVLGKWRRFWGQTGSRLLSGEEQLGLLGELWFLLNWLGPKAGFSEAISRWRGPHGARHDFEWAGWSIEVKATRSSRGIIHRINGLDQLMPPVQGRLFLFSMRVSEEAGANLNLPGLVGQCRARLSSEPDLIERFEEALLAIGYSLVHEADYAEALYRIVDEGVYDVSADFPRITPENFVPQPGIEKVVYDINLDTFRHLLRAMSPSELAFE